MASNVLWVIQSNLGNRDTLAQFRTVLGHLQLPHREVVAIPFSDEVPDVDWDGPTVFYGATGFIEKAWRSGRFRPCAFFDDEYFRFSHWRNAFGDDLLNQHAVVTTLAGFAAMPHASESEWFVRPDRDSKVFAGEVIRFADAQTWAQRLSFGGFTFGDEESIVVAEPTAISTEWRLFMVEGKVSSASQYRKHLRLSPGPEVPAEVIAFGERCAARFDITPVFVLDIAETVEGLKVIEVNCFNSAGFYAANLLDIVRDVSGCVERNWS